MEALPAEMIEEILVRVAVKSLLRFKCVCRRWCALIQSRSFIHRHYYHDTNKERLISLMEERDDDRLMFSYFGERNCFRMGAVFGLFCEVNVSGDIVLLNPATHMVKRVPRLPTVNLRGFGLDPRSGDYSIVAIERRAAEAYVWVFNASSDCWKRVEVVGSRSVVKAGHYISDSKATFSNGVYYWLQVLALDGGYEILALDMKSQKFREIKAPHGVGDDDVIVNRIVAYGDSIALISHKHELWVIWVMGKQGIWSKNWTLKDSSSRLCLLCLWKNKVLFWNSAVLREYNLVDVSTGEVERVVATNHPIQFPPFSFKESLVWFK